MFNLTIKSLFLSVLTLPLILIAEVKATVTPSTTQLVQDSVVPINVTWRYNTGPLGEGTTSSQQGIFINPNAREVLGVINTPLTRLTNANQFVSFPESIFVPASVIAQASDLGLKTIQYQRTFNIGTDPASGGAARVETDILTIQLKSLSQLSIERIALRFDNDQIVRTIGKGEQSRVIAQINYQQAGLLDAVWEVATPPSTSSRPFYRPIQNIRRYLGAGGNALVQSPVLPAEIVGNHLVRLRVKQPQLRFSTTELRYVVTANSEKDLASLAKIRVMQPPENARLTSSTEFQWQTIPGADAYQLEIFAASAFEIAEKSPRYQEEIETTNRFQVPKGSPITGILVPGETNRLSLSQVSQQHLMGNREYLWRVIAISEKGNIIAVSPIRAIKTP
ncbi:hypothetical protein FLL45_09360 [Aliikangiella marina]|uniref:Uncharacterized protein n=1 Tax=Aliikangiella marina TaxID=1712262 RepID=A0A545TD47_9GAMM|nr:hypothetical protein [Aliikangiella marina]TQV75135.1 hypothetical protein FLL45_09360 [Aliikangiella marina]